MASLSSYRPNFVFSSFPSRVPNSNPLFHGVQFRGLSHHKPFLRGSLAVARFGFKPEFLPDPDNAEGFVRELFGKAESVLYTIADAAVSASPENVTTAKQTDDWFTGITNYMESILKILKDGLSALHVPYAYGFAIILLTVLVKAATFPLTKKQVESAMAMRSLQPQVKAVQQRYAGDQERIQLETARLYKLAGVNPLAGCLPTLATIPVWIGLYRALSNVANEGLLTEGFFWIPSLAGPTTITSRQNGSGVSWLFPFVDGHPPLGWSDTFAYLVLPVLLVVSQYISVQIMQSSQNNDPSMKSSQAITKFLPLMIGYFALSVPSGLSLYWLTNNILSTAQQAWLQKLGGAKNPDKQFIDEIIKQEQARVQSEPPKLNPISSSTVSRQEEKLTAEGLKPGERFKQLKEQEARLRQQREEEKRKAEEAAKVESLTINDSDKSTTVRVVVNGSLSRQEVKEDQNSTTTTTMQRTDVDNEPSATQGEGVLETYTMVAKDAKLNGEEQRE
ncbi:ALBINO3-like protein 1, chloroplastic [Benincasa hispida]|uniref:ALBINO3-like protein 1, chloroplastic n=1 Tax=Benincasa hispida TaxID=102211 RepID=UPI0018FFB0F1|nr:ALBINO3-like protein 1, chloroplastic [Benincasa hispida]